MAKLCPFPKPLAGFCERYFCAATLLFHLLSYPAAPVVDSVSLTLPITHTADFRMPMLRYLFLVKVIIMPFFGFGLFGWAVGSAKGFGPVFNKPTKITTGVPPAVVFFTAMSSAIAPKATIALNSEA